MKTNRKVESLSLITALLMSLPTIGAHASATIEVVSAEALSGAERELMFGAPDNRKPKKRAAKKVAPKKKASRASAPEVTEDEAPAQTQSAPAPQDSIPRIRVGLQNSNAAVNLCILAMTYDETTRAYNRGKPMVSEIANHAQVRARGDYYCNMHSRGVLASGAIMAFDQLSGAGKCQTSTASQSVNTLYDPTSFQTQLNVHGSYESATFVFTRITCTYDAGARAASTAQPQAPAPKKEFNDAKFGKISVDMSVIHAKKGAELGSGRVVDVFSGTREALVQFEYAASPVRVSFDDLIKY